MTIGDLALNKETLIVTWRNKKLPLHPLQVHLLEFLMLNPRRPITRMELLNNVWNTDTSIEIVTIDRNVKRIRDAFKREAKSDPIRTVRRVGYVFNDQFEQLSSPSEKGHLVNAHHLTLPGSAAPPGFQFGSVDCASPLALVQRACCVNVPDDGARPPRSSGESRTCPGQDQVRPPARSIAPRGPCRNRRLRFGPCRLAGPLTLALCHQILI